MKIISIIISIIFIGGYIFFRSWHHLMIYKDKQAGRKYCEENKLNFLSTKSYELHTRLYFEKDGIEYWANYETDKNYNITWKKETPEEKIEKYKKNK